jgi:hypothetical protein
MDWATGILLRSFKGYSEISTFHRGMFLIVFTAIETILGLLLKLSFSLHILVFRLSILQLKFRLRLLSKS